MLSTKYFELNIPINSRTSLCVGNAISLELLLSIKKGYWHFYIFHTEHISDIYPLIRAFLS